MANKFQKSVLERLEQEAIRQKQKAKPAEEQRDEKPTAKIEEFEAVHTVPIPEPEPADKVQPAVQKKPEPASPPDIGEYLRRDNQRLAKNKTFYLDNDVIESVKATARAQRVTDSKLVNDILRRVLGLS